MVDEEVSGRNYGWRRVRDACCNGVVVKTFLTHEVPFVVVRREALRET